MTYFPFRGNKWHSLMWERKTQKIQNELTKIWMWLTENIFALSELNGASYYFDHNNMYKYTITKCRFNRQWTDKRWWWWWWRWTASEPSWSGWDVFYWELLAFLTTKPRTPLSPPKTLTGLINIWPSENQSGGSFSRWIRHISGSNAVQLPFILFRNPV